MSTFFKRCILPVCIICLITGCTSVQGTYAADVYGNTVSIVFLTADSARLTVNGQDFPAQIVRKDGIIEIWQMRKTPAIYVKKINSSELRLLNREKTETEIIFKKQ